MNKTHAEKQILRSFLENIACISDKEYQNRIWVKAEGPECDDIDDTVCDFFDDGESIFERYQNFDITQQQYKLLMVLHNKLRVFTDTYGLYCPEKSTKYLIDLPEWQEIRDLAKEVLKAFYYH